MKVRPLFDNLVVRRAKPAEMSKGGIYLPSLDPAKTGERAAEGEVLASGPGRLSGKGTRIPCEPKPGDHIIFNRHGAQELMRLPNGLVDTDCVIVSELDVFCIVE